MNRTSALVGLLLLTLAGTAPAATDEQEQGTAEVSKSKPAKTESAIERERTAITYSSIGLSRLSTGFDNVKDAVSIDVASAFRIPGVNWFGVELNLGFTIIPGEVERVSSTPGAGCPPLDPFCTPTPGNTTRSQDDFQALNIGVFGVFRSPGRIYGMGKIGYRYTNTNLPELDDDRSGGAWGAGFGYRYNEAGGFAELQYTRLSRDLDLIGFALGYGFGGK